MTKYATAHYLGGGAPCGGGALEAIGPTPFAAGGALCTDIFLKCKCAITSTDGRLIATDCYLGDGVPLGGGALDAMGPVRHHLP